MVTCPLSAEEAVCLQEGLEALLTQTGEIRRPAPGAAPWTRIGSFPCFLTLVSTATQELITTPGHQDRVNAEVLLPKTAPLEPNDVVLVDGHRFVTRMIDPDDTGLLRALGRVER